MAATTVTVRCRGCGGYLSALGYAGAPAVYYRCPHCGRPVPVVVPRPLAPLYTWEVYPQLYPTPLPLRFAPSGRGTVLFLSLLLAAGLLVPTGGLVAVTGVQSLHPGTTTVSGTVVMEFPSGNQPLPFAPLSVRGEDGFLRQVTADGSGAFVVTGVPMGGIEINASTSGGHWSSLSILVSAVYSSPATGGVGISVVTVPGENRSATLSPFPDLTTLAGSLFAGSALALVAAGFAVVGGFRGRHDPRPTVAVVGGAAALFTPVAIGLLGAGLVNPTAFGLSLLAGLSGTIAVALGAWMLARRGAPVVPL